MHTKAVFRSAQALAAAGFDVLRFNFRGVGTSTGSYGNGIGEQEDVRAALDWMEARSPGEPILLGGFSFGSKVALRVGIEDPRAAALIGLGLPLSTNDFTFLDGLSKPLLIVQGEFDEFGGRAEIEAFVATLRGELSLAVIPESDHYFHDHFEELQAVIGEYVRVGAGSRPFAAHR